MTVAPLLPDDVREAIYAHARQDYPNECCGGVWRVGEDDRATWEVVRYTNVQDELHARDPARYRTVAPTAAKVQRLDVREHLVWRRAAAYVTITQTLAHDLALRYGPRETVFVVPDGEALLMDGAIVTAMITRAPSAADLAQTAYGKLRDTQIAA